MEKEGRVNEYMRLYWVVLVLGEVEVTTRLAAIYEKGEIFEKDIEESGRLRRIFVTQFQKSTDGLEWRISQEVKTLFIRGNVRMNNYNLLKAPWEEYKSTIQSVIIKEGVESIGRCALSGCKELEGFSIPSSINTINANPFYRLSQNGDNRYLKR